ncbi:MAG: hypothetical protein O7E52_21690, partial [Candidatus Poribacteria bacterium]|nr:hypothetical protein [Candidatus Poribacteria bacterium]
MMKQILVCIVFSSGFFLIAVLPIKAELVDATAWWLIVSPDTNVDSQGNRDALVRLLEERGKIPSQHLRRLEGNQSTRDGIQV